MFNDEIISFRNNLEVIKGFIDFLEPVLLDKIKEDLTKDSEDLIALRLLFNEMDLDNDSEFKLTEEAKQKIKENFDGDIIIESSEDSEGYSLSVSGNGGDRFDKAMSNLGKLNQQKMLLYKSTLMNIISTVECFLGDVLRVYFNEYKNEISPALILKKDKQFTMDELESFDTVEDAKTFIIDSKLENIIRSSFQDWIDFLKEKLHLSMGYLNDEIDKLTEIFQRRNIIVHNKGIVNSIYLSKVSDKYSKDVKKGEPIFLDREYLESAIDSLELNFTLIAFELWKTKRKDDDTRFKLLSDIIDDNLVKVNWKKVKGYSIFLGNDACCSLWFKMYSKINNWLSYKRMGYFDEIKGKVLAEDFSACTLDFQICQQALLNNNEKVFELMKHGLENNAINFESIEAWPVFEEFREDELYEQLKELFKLQTFETKNH